MGANSGSSGRFSVGQVVFIFSREKSQLRPARVVQETTQKTIEGVRTSYSIQFSPSEPDDELFDIDKLKEEVFATADEAQRTLIDRTTNSIKKLVANAVQRAGTMFPESLDELTRPDDAQHRAVRDVNEQLIELPDGTLARVRMKE